MSKDPFNGNIKKEYINYVKFSLIFATVLFFAFFVFFLLFALLYEKIEYAARILMFVFSHGYTSYHRYYTIKSLVYQMMYRYAI